MKSGTAPLPAAWPLTAINRARIPLTAPPSELPPATGLAPPRPETATEFRGAGGETGIQGGGNDKVGSADTKGMPSDRTLGGRVGCPRTQVELSDSERT